MERVIIKKGTISEKCGECPKQDLHTIGYGSISREFDLEEIILSCVDSVRSSVSWKDPEIEIVSSCDASFFASPNIELALYNIIQNAVKYQNHERPRVSIETLCMQNGFVRISIIDDGPGISGTIRSDIFDDDYMLRRGKGLGLRVARYLIENSCGKMEIIASEGDRGTVVAIDLPMSN